jgi:hypothetical protein
MLNDIEKVLVSEEEIKAEEALLKQPKPKKHRKSWIEQINEINETIIAENEEEEEALAAEEAPSAEEASTESAATEE